MDNAENLENMKIVDFDEYCPKCIHKNEINSDPELTVCESCHQCLNVPARQYSHKPEKFEAKH